MSDEPAKRDTFCVMRGLLAVFVLASAAVVGCGPTDQSDDSADSESWDGSVKPFEDDIRPTPDDDAEESDPSTEPAPVPSNEQLAALTEKLRPVLVEANPGFNGEAFVMAAQPNPDSGVMTAALGLNDPAVTDITPIADAPVTIIDLKGCRITDLSPLKGVRLTQAYLEDNAIDDLSPLAGMPLEKVYLSNNPVSDLSPLEGAPLRELNLVGTAVDDLEPLRAAPLRTLWLNECPVADLAPIAKCPLQSLTVANTEVSDLTPLKGMPLERLHIGGSAVTDLTPIRWLRLQRLIFTPQRIEAGIDYARQMPTLREIDVRFGGNRPMSPQEFWARYDAGEL